MTKALLLIFSILIASLLGNSEVLQANQLAVRERLAQAEQYVAEGEIDFAFMEFRALLQEDPDERLAQKATFAIGEYYFKQRSTREAKEAFKAFYKSATEEIPKLLATVYLLQCARFVKDMEAVQAFELRLKETLSSKKLFLAFEENRMQEWTSPLGNRFQLREFIDRLEISLNDTPFYDIHLP